MKDYQKQYRENNPLTEHKKQKMQEYQKSTVRKKKKKKMRKMFDVII